MLQSLLSRYAVTSTPSSVLMALSAASSSFTLGESFIVVLLLWAKFSKMSSPPSALTEVNSAIFTLFLERTYKRSRRFEMLAERNKGYLEDYENNEVGREMLKRCMRRRDEGRPAIRFKSFREVFTARDT